MSSLQEWSVQTNNIIEYIAYGKSFCFHRITWIIPFTMTIYPLSIIGYTSCNLEEYAHFKLFFLYSLIYHSISINCHIISIIFLAVDNFMRNIICMILFEFMFSGLLIICIYCFIKGPVSKYDNVYIIFLIIAIQYVAILFIMAMVSIATVVHGCHDNQLDDQLNNQQNNLQNNQHIALEELIIINNCVNNNKACPICFESLETKRIIQLPCEHVFCYYCIHRWSNTSNTCPICRRIYP